jgi:mannose-6-phosphate isomerase-like protein (cupin superfamily)
MKPTPHLIKLNMKSTNYQRVLSGSPETSTMRSGLVTLAPGKAVGKHNTEKFEELVVILEGNGVMLLSDGDTLHFSKGDAAYCPYHTEHDVLNTGSDTLRYIYIVAEAKK